MHLIWLSNRTPPKVEFLLTLMTLSNLSRMVFSTSTGFLVSKKLTEVDGWVFLSGLSLLMLQYSPQVWILDQSRLFHVLCPSRSMRTLSSGWSRRKTPYLEQRQPGGVQRDSVQKIFKTNKQFPEVIKTMLLLLGHDRMFTLCYCEAGYQPLL